MRLTPRAATRKKRPRLVSEAMTFLQGIELIEGESTEDLLKRVENIIREARGRVTLSDRIAVAQLIRALDVNSLSGLQAAKEFTDRTEGPVRVEIKQQTKSTQYVVGVPMLPPEIQKLGPEEQWDAMLKLQGVKLIGDGDSLEAPAGPPDAGSKLQG